MKSKQIESQQSLLADLQAQLSAKETENSQLKLKTLNFSKEIESLNEQLSALQLQIKEQAVQIEKLKSQSATNQQPPPPPPALILQKRRSCIPKKNALKTLSTSLGSTPVRLVGTSNNTGPRLVAVGSKKIQLFDRDSSLIISDFTLPNGSLCLSLAFSSDNSLLLVGTTEHEFLVFDVPNRRLVTELKGCQGKIKGCGFLGSKRMLFSASSDRQLRVWNLEKGGPIRSFSLTSQVCDATVSEDGSIICLGHQNGRISTWSATEKLSEFDAHTEACVGIAISRCSRYVASIGQDDKIAITDITTGMKKIGSNGGFTAFQDSSFPAISPDNRMVCVCSATEGAVYCFELATGNFMGKFGSEILCVFWGRKDDEFEILTAGKKGELKWWEATETFS